MAERDLLNDALSLLSEGLDLCVRARKLDEAITKAVAVGRTTETHCLTPALWVQDAYDRDLAEWEERAKAFLIKHTPVGGFLKRPAPLLPADRQTEGEEG